MQHELGQVPEAATPALNVLLLYDAASLTANTIRDHLESFSQFSRHQIYYAHATANAPLQLPLDLFDVVVIHYTVRLSVDFMPSPYYAAALERYRGLKVLFIQDEYDNPLQACRWINRLGIDVIFSNVPESHRRRVYPLIDHERVQFFPTLTGFVPLRLGSLPLPPPLSARRNVLGYRGRRLSYVYGRLGQEKALIGERMRAICAQRDLPHDIEWTEEKRIYGSAWFEFLGNCRATLGTESGSNVFDDDGTLAPAIAVAVQDDPSLSFAAVAERFLNGRDGEDFMNQISPRVFEAIAMKTGLVLFEGRYSGIVKPDVHFISLRKDFSNVDDVLAKVRDDLYLGAMIQRAYQDVVECGCYSYQAFVRNVDAVLAARARPQGRRIVARACCELSAYQEPRTVYDTWVVSTPFDVRPFIEARSGVEPDAMKREFSRLNGKRAVTVLWRACPAWIKARVRAILARRLPAFFGWLRSMLGRPH